MKSLTTLLSAFFMATLLPLSTAHAAEAATKTYAEPWGMAGCGLWTYVIKEKQQGPQLGVWALRHFVLDSQTFAISSGTSNCVQSRTETASIEKKVYISVNLASLSKQAAQGEGEHLEALAEIFGCPHPAFAHLSQSRYDAIFEAHDPDAVLRNYVREVHAHQDLADTCARPG